MYAVDYQKPKSLADAAALLTKTGGKPLAGGQSLVAAMKLRLAQPGTLVDLAAIPDLGGIRKDGEAIVTNKRRITAADFFKGMYETALGADEIIVAVSFPVPKKAAYVKFPNPAS